ncbi:MAG TPA: ABC transporter substrate-binding protein [Acidimicrobiales bacterium]|nr:ABC transporter substrate-binding protein [Acidimicrobiales bacterium]
MNVTSATPAGAASTVPIMVSASLDSPVVSNPPMFQGVEAAVSYLNANGGLHGHHIRLIKCDNKNTPNLEVACARQAVSTKVIALVGSNFETNPTGVKAILGKGGVPNIAPVGGTPTLADAPTDFDIWSFLGTRASIGQAMGTRTCKTGTGVAVNVPIANLSVDYVKVGMKTGGVKPVTTVEVPISATGYAPAIEQLTSLKATCVFPVIVETQYLPYFQALQSAGSKVRNFVPSVGFPTEALKTIGAAGSKNTVETSTYLTPLANSSTPQVRLFMKEMKKYQPGAHTDGESENSWVSVMTLNQVTKGLTKWTAAGVLNAIRHASHVNVGFGVPTLNFTKKNPTPKLSAIYDTKYHIHIVKSGTQFSDTNTILTVESTLKKMTLTATGK